MAQQPIVSPPPSKFKMSEGYSFRLRQHLDHPSFHNLWELAIVDEKGRIKEILEDANGLNYCLDAIEGLMVSEGH
jgi:hypothetical protein